MKKKATAMDENRSIDSGSSTADRAATPQGTSFSGPEFFPVPVDIVEQLFLHVPPNEVICVCRLVCQQWKEVADTEALWRERCRREGYLRRDRIPPNWRTFYFLCKTRKNLLKNPSGEDDLDGWVMKLVSGWWRVDDVIMEGSNEVAKKNFVTTYGMCTKEQLIELENEGYSPAFMDRIQPDIKVSDWCASRCDSGAYSISVQLLNAEKKVVQSFAPRSIYLDKWRQIIHVFRDYGPGVRYIHFLHGATDTQFWAGYYGVRVTDSTVEICPAGASGASGAKP